MASLRVLPPLLQLPIRHTTFSHLREPSPTIPYSGSQRSR